MKKKLIIISLILVFIIGIGYYLYSRDNIRFKFSYEILNSSNEKEVNVNIPFDNRIKYLSNKELDKFLESGTGLIYFGYSSCPWCRNIVPVLIDVVKENDIDTINYVDIHKVDIKKSSVYKKLSNYFREDDDGNKVLAVPDVYVIKDGKVLDHHLGTVEGYRNPYKGMSDEEINELKDIYTNMIKEMKK